MPDLKTIFSSGNQWIRLAPWMLLFFLLPVFPVLVSTSIVIIALSLAFQFYNLKWNLKRFPFLILPVIIYLFYLAGTYWTDTPGMAAIVIERKLSFIIFPVLFLLVRPFSHAERFVFLGTFTLGAFVHSVISLAAAAACYFSPGGSKECFFSSAFSYELHPSYIALYDVTIILFTGVYLIANADRLSRRQKLIFLIVISWFAIVCFLLASKSGIISLVIVLIFLLLYYIINKRKLKQGIIAFVALIVLFAVSMLFTSVPLERFRAIFSSSGMSEQELFEKYRETTESTPVRKMIWVCAREIIAEQPLGLGSGDGNAALMEKYSEKGMTGAMERELNAHNQYYQVTLALGYPGLILLILFLLIPLLIVFKRKNILSAVFILLVALNLAVESMFETQAGIVFILLFYCLLLTGADDDVSGIKGS